MPASAALAAYGTLLKIGDGGGTEVFTTIGEVHNIDGMKMKTDTKETTSHSSPGATKEYIATLLDAGEVTFDISWVPTSATHNATTGLRRDWKNRTRRNFQLVYPDVGASTDAFSGIVVGFEGKAPVDDRLSANVSIKVTGQPTLV